MFTTPQLRGDISKYSVSVSEQVIKHKKNIISQQVLLNRVADVAILLQSMGSVISRSNNMAEKVINLATSWGAKVTTCEILFNFYNLKSARQLFTFSKHLDIMNVIM